MTPESTKEWIKVPFSRKWRSKLKPLLKILGILGLCVLLQPVKRVIPANEVDSVIAQSLVRCYFL